MLRLIDWTLLWLPVCGAAVRVICQPLFGSPRLWAVFLSLAVVAGPARPLTVAFEPYVGEAGPPPSDVRPQTVSLRVEDRQAHDTGWVQAGKWNVVTGNNPSSVVAGTPTNPTTSTQTFTFTARDPDGAADVSHIYFQFAATANDSLNGCVGFYDLTANAFYLFSDTLSAVGPLIPGTSTLRNTQCVLEGSTSSLASSSGTDVTFQVGVTLLGSYARPQTVFLWVEDREAHETGWVQTGKWNIVTGNNPSSVVAGTPTNPTTSTQTFTFTARDPDGAADISRIYFQFAATANDSLNGCVGFYDLTANAFYLYSDGLSALGPLIPGTSTLRNTVSVRGNHLFQ